MDFEFQVRCSECKETLEVDSKEQIWETLKLGRVYKGLAFYMKPCKCQSED